MYKQYFVACALSLCCSLVFQVSQAQVGKPFPSMITERLDGEEVNLPQATRGGYALIGIATTQKAEDELRTWQRPVYNKFIAKTGMMDQLWNVEVVFIPVFTGAAKAAKASVVKKLKENNEKMVADHLLIYSGENDPVKNLGIDDKKSTYFFLVSPNGRVVWSASGPFRQKYFDEIEAHLGEE